MNLCNCQSCIVTDKILEMFVKFAGSEATEECCRRFNKLFDILNSWNINAKGDKEPLNKTNLEEKKKVLEDITTFLRQLKLPNGRLVSVSKKKTCVIGFLATIKSTIMLVVFFFSPTQMRVAEPDFSLLKPTPFFPSNVFPLFVC